MTADSLGSSPTFYGLGLRICLGNGIYLSGSMSMKTVYSRLLEALHNLPSARDGNVAITFALATNPMIGFVGAAVDYSRANAVKASMQAALDSGASGVPGAGRV